MLVAGGSTNVTTYFAMRLAADGTAATGLTATNFDLQYVRSGAAPSAKVDATAGTAGGAAAHVDNTVVEPDATDQPGLYRIDWPDAAFAAGVREVILTVKVATAFTEHLRVEIDGEVNVVEWAGTDVVAGAIPAAAADSAGGLPISDAGGLDLDGMNTNINDIETDTGTTLPATLALIPQSGGTTSWNATALAAINAEADTALTDYDPPTKAELDTAVGSVTLANGAHGGAAASLTLSDYSNFTGAGAGLTALATGTAQSGTASTIVLTSGATFADNELNGNVINIHTGTGAGQSRVILSNTNVDDTVNVTPNWTTNPGADSQYEIVQGSTNTASVSLTAQTANDNGADINEILIDTAEIGAAGAGLTNIGTIATCTTVTNGVSLANGAVTDASLAGNMEIVFETDFATNYNTTRNAWATNAQDFVGTSAADPFNGQVVSASVTGAVGSVTGGATAAAQTTAQNDLDIITGASGVVLADNSITAAKIANAAIDAATFAADVDAEILSYIVDDATKIDASQLNTHANITPATAANVNAEVVDVLRTDTLPDSYAADGAQPTIAQAILAIHQMMQEQAISGTTLTVNKPDGTTAAMTFTLNDASTPTAVTRAS